MAAMRSRSWRRATANASRVGCSTITIQSRSGIRTPTASMRSPAVPGRLPATTGVAGACLAQRGHHGIRGQAGAARHPRALVRVAVGQQLAARADDHRVAGRPDADAVRQAPEFLDAELADEPAGVLPAAAERRRDEHGRQQIVVDEHRRHADAADRRGVRARDRHARRADPARGDRRPRRRRTAVSSRNSGNRST